MEVKIDLYGVIEFTADSIRSWNNKSGGRAKALVFMGTQDKCKEFMDWYPPETNGYYKLVHITDPSLRIVVNNVTGKIPMQQFDFKD